MYFYDIDFQIHNLKMSYTGIGFLIDRDENFKYRPDHSALFVPLLGDEGPILVVNFLLNFMEFKFVFWWSK